MTLTLTLDGTGELLAGVYALGVLLGLVLTDGSALTRVGLSLIWPLGPIAFVATVTFLLGVAGVAFPLFGVVLLALLGAVLWMTL